MFPLSGTQFPTTSAELASAIAGTLAGVFAMPDPPAAVVVSGDFPNVREIKLLLTNALVTGPFPPKPEGVGPRTGRITAGALSIDAHPVRYQGAAIDVAFAARDVRFAFDRDAAGKPLLMLTDAAQGTVAVSISKRDLEAVLLAAARQGAQGHGVAIEDVKLDLISRGERSLDVDALLKVRKGFSGSFHVKARVVVNDQLIATLSGLSAKGVDFVGGIAATMVQPKLTPFEGKQFPLAALSLGDVKLRDVKIAAGETVRVNAAFGK